MKKNYMFTRRPAVPPRRRTGPRRVNIYFFPTILGFILGPIQTKQKRTKKKKCSIAKHHDSLVYLSVFKWTGILTYINTPIFRNYILKFRAWPGFSMKNLPRQAPVPVFKILSATAVKLYIFSSSAVLLQWRSKSWKLAWEHIAAYFWSKCRTQLRKSVSKMGFTLPDLKIHSKSARTFQKKNGKSWSLKNRHFSAEKKSSFLGSPKCVSLLRAAPGCQGSILR